MIFLTSKKSDLNSIMKIISEAQRYLASQGIDQWQDGYPDESLILEDINNSESYIVKNDDGNLLGIAMFTTQSEPTYTFIDGKWLTSEDAKYGVIHRMAVGSNHRGMGIAKYIFSECELILKENKVASMRIDTHEENIGMQSLLKKIGYVYCGVIFLGNGDKRLAFEKILFSTL